MIVCKNCGYDNNKEAKMCGMCSFVEKNSSPQVSLIAIPCHDLLSGKNLIDFDISEVYHRANNGITSDDLVKISEYLHYNNNYSDKQFKKTKDQLTKTLKNLIPDYVDEYKNQGRTIDILSNEFANNEILIFNNNQFTSLKIEKKGILDLFKFDYIFNFQNKFKDLTDILLKKYFISSGNNIDAVLDCKMIFNTGNMHSFKLYESSQEHIKLLLNKIKLVNPNIQLKTEKELIPEFIEIIGNYLTNYSLFSDGINMYFMNLKKEKYKSLNEAKLSYIFSPLNDITGLHIDYFTVEEHDIKYREKETWFGSSFGISGANDSISASLGVSFGGKNKNAQITGTSKKKAECMRLTVYSSYTNNPLKLNYVDIDEARNLANKLHQYLVKNNSNIKLNESVF